MISKRLFSVFGLLIVGASIVLAVFHFSAKSRPANLLSSTLAVTLPGSATNVMAVKRTVRDSRVVELWATVDLSLDDAEQLAASAGAKRLPTGCTVNPPPPVHALRNWQPAQASTDNLAPIAWLSVSSEDPDYLALQWTKNRLRLYYFGIPRR